MYNTGYLYRSGTPGIDHNEGIEIPKAVFSAQQFVVIVANSRRASECLESIVQTLA